MCCTFKINGNVDAHHANCGFACGLESMCFFVHRDQEVYQAIYTT